MPANAPYNDLYIYYLKGRVPAAENRLGRSFVGNWQEDDTAFLFFTEPADGQVQDLLGRNPDVELLDQYHMPYADWHGGELQAFTTDRFEVAPPWIGNTKTGNKLPISLDPGVVFGAGTHPTTRDCLEAIEIACDAGAVQTVLDLGTGTGLLALAAVKLGCSRVLAVDNNYLAARTARYNAMLNGMADRVLAVCADARQCIQYSADLLVANIHFDVMRHLIASPAFYEKKWFVLSGLLRSEARQVEELIHFGPGRIVRRWINDGVWHTFLGTWKDAGG